MTERATGDRADACAGLWDFAVEAYGRPGVAALCKELQDKHGADVCLLFLARWLDGRRVPLDHAAAAACRELARRWGTGVIVPLRQVRRTLAADLAELTLPDPATVQLGVRSMVADAELLAERALLMNLQAIVRDIPSAQGFTARAWLVELWPESRLAQSEVDGFWSATTKWDAI